MNAASHLRDMTADPVRSSHERRSGWPRSWQEAVPHVLVGLLVARVVWLGTLNEDGVFQPQACVALAPHAVQDGETRYAATVTPAVSGLAALRLRAWPTHPLLAHRFEMGRMRWL